jgi:hypothetical protein
MKILPGPPRHLYSGAHKAPNKYRWSEWKDGVWREFEVGRDFKCTTASFARQAIMMGFVTTRHGNTVAICWEKPTP